MAEPGYCAAALIDEATPSRLEVLGWRRAAPDYALGFRSRSSRLKPLLQESNFETVKLGREERMRHAPQKELGVSPLTHRTQGKAPQLGVPVPGYRQASALGITHKRLAQ